MKIENRNIGSRLKTTDDKIKNYSFEGLVVEMVRRGYLTIDEGKACMVTGTVTEEILLKIDERMKFDPEADIPGSKRIDSEQEHMKRFLKIRFLVNPDVSN